LIFKGQHVFNTVLETLIPIFDYVEFMGGYCFVNSFMYTHPQLTFRIRNTDWKYYGLPAR